MDPASLMEPFATTMQQMRDYAMEHENERRAWVQNHLQTMPADLLSKDLAPEIVETLFDTHFIQDMEIFLVKLGLVFYHAADRVSATPRPSEGMHRILQGAEVLCTPMNLLVDDNTRVAFVDNGLDLVAGVEIPAPDGRDFMLDMLHKTVDLLQTYLFQEWCWLSDKLRIRTLDGSARVRLDKNWRETAKFRMQFRKAYWHPVYSTPPQRPARPGVAIKSTFVGDSMNEILASLTRVMPVVWDEVNDSVMWASCREFGNLRLASPSETAANVVPHRELPSDMYRVVRDEYFDRHPFVTALREFVQLRF